MTFIHPTSANRFRFRAWDKETHVMDYLEELTYFTLNDGGCVLMQSTGLTDEDGEELFECDIVDCEIKDASGLRTARYVIWWFSQFGEYVLCDVDGFSLAGHTYHTAQSMSKFGAETLLKIGNIYENPDLLPNS